MQDRLDQNIRRYYGSRQLDPATLSRLKAKIAGAEPGDHGERKPEGWPLVAAAVLAMVIVGLGSVLLFVSSSDSPNVSDEIARQAALGHNQKLDVEFRADEYRDLRQSMPKLGFTPVRPARFEGMDMTIVGARYGSIEGQPAIQITLLDPNGDICTLYQVRPAGTLASLTPSTREIDGLAVDLWQEKGLLMVLARPAA